MYLIDTVALSELRKRERDPRMVRWLRNKRADSLFLSVVTIGEIERGIFRQRRVNPVFAEALGAWLDRTVDIYGDRILPVDTTVARRGGRLRARIGHRGAELLITATALRPRFSVI